LVWNVKPVNGCSAEIKSSTRARIISEDGKGWVWNTLRWCREVECGTDAERCLLFILTTYANKDGECWPGVETLAADMRTAPRHVQRLLRRLEQRGHIATMGRSRRNGRQSTNGYWLNVWGVNERVKPDSGVTPYP
jgi:hypothetical protein